MGIDLNCDTGEGIGNDAAIMPFITSANIACGFHAGDETTMRATLRLTKQHGVAAGAHPSFPDRENFGRKEMHLPLGEVYQLVKQQVMHLQLLANEVNIVITHVKPHGALYNMAAKDEALATAIANAVKDCGVPILFGLSGSCLIRAGAAAGLKTASEVFADRTYNDDGSLTPRSQPGALLETEEEMVQQVSLLIQQQKVRTLNGKKIAMIADTVCLHGDGPHAVAFAQRLSTLPGIKKRSILPPFSNRL